MTMSAEILTFNKTYDRNNMLEMGDNNASETFFHKISQKFQSREGGCENVHVALKFGMLLDINIASQMPQRMKHLKH